MAAFLKNMAASQRQVQTPSPISSSQSALVKKRKKRSTDEEMPKLDIVLEAMVQSVNDMSASLDRLQHNIRSRRSTPEIDLFYVMVASRAQKLSPSARAWMEDRIFITYREADRIDIAPSQSQYQHSAYTMPQQSYQNYQLQGTYHTPSPTQNTDARDTGASCDGSKGGFELV